eukprot:15496006-Heterocapsa_arctica.AAC.1
METPASLLGLLSLPVAIWAYSPEEELRIGRATRADRCPCCAGGLAAQRLLRRRTGRADSQT